MIERVCGSSSNTHTPPLPRDGFLWVPCRWMYWTDWEEDPKESKRGRIERAWMDGSNRNMFLSSKTVLWPNGLSLDVPQGILYWVDAYYDRIEMVYLNSSERKVCFFYVFGFACLKVLICSKRAFWPFFAPADGVRGPGAESRLRPVPL